MNQTEIWPAHALQMLLKKIKTKGYLGEGFTDGMKVQFGFRTRDAMEKIYIRAANQSVIAIDRGDIYSTTGYVHIYTDDARIVIRPGLEQLTLNLEVEKFADDSIAF